MSSYFPAELSGAQNVTLLPGLAYSVDNHTEITGSAFTFTLDAAGNVAVSSPAAAGSGTSLIFNTKPVTINPSSYSGRYILISFYPSTFTGVQNLALLPGLTYSIDDTSLIGGSAFIFSVDAAGNVSTISQAASGSGNVLTFSNVPVHVDAGGYSGIYSLGGYSNLTGPANVVLFPTLTVRLIAGAQDGQLTPGLCTVTPSTLFGFTFVVTPPGPGCGPVYTGSVQPPIKPNGSSVFKSGRGVVPVKFTLAANNASTCQLPAAVISLLRTSGSAPGPINQSDYIMPSDNGSNFRVDGCQYIYNLGVGSLGVGQYMAQLNINGVVVGSGVFGLD